MESKTITEMTRWQLAKMMAGAAVTPPKNESYNEHDIKLLQMSAFVQFIQLDHETLLELAHESLRHYKEKPDTEFLVEV
jgi:hypothetical protein